MKNKKHELPDSRVIFVVTTMQIKDENLNSNKFFDNKSRSVGWFNLFKDAEYCVINNACDIYECGTYNYVVIEECTEGFYCCTQKETWYIWNKEIKKYERCEKPPCYKCVISFGIGYLLKIFTGIEV
jgi:hypothetical protein